MNKQAPTLLRLLNQYAANFVDSVDGNSGEISLQELFVFSSPCYFLFFISYFFY
jgi:hypothetical protein